MILVIKLSVKLGMALIVSDSRLIELTDIVPSQLLKKLIINLEETLVSTVDKKSNKILGIILIILKFFYSI